MIAELIAQGARVFPLSSHPGRQKTPAAGGWMEWATCDLDRASAYQTANPAANWGVFCGGSGLIVVDLDVKGGADGLADWEGLQAIHGDAPPTYAVATPSGGRHLYFRGDGPSTVRKLAPGVDTRGRGGYVVGPGSLMRDAEGVVDGVYELVHPGPIADAPAWLLSLLAEAVPPAPLLPSPEVPLDRPHHLQAARDYLAEAPICEEAGDRGGEYLLQVAMRLRDMGLSQDAASALALSDYSPRCDPPWDMDDDHDRAHWDAKFINAYKYAQNPKPGAATPEACQSRALEEFAEFIPEDEAPRPKAGPIRIQDLTQGTAPARDWIIPDWLPSGELSSLYGGGSTGKSLLSLQLLLSVASGVPWLGQPIASPMPCLGVYCEDSQDELHRRVDAIRSAPEYMGAEIKHELLLWPRAGEDNAIAKASGDDVIAGAFLGDLREALRAMGPGPKLLILDTLSDIYMGDENTREKVNKVLKVHLAKLCQQTNATPILLAHPSRLGASNGDMLSGSTAWSNAVRNRWGLKKDETGGTVLTRIKSNYSMQGDEIPIEWEGGRYAVREINTEEMRSLILAQWLGTECRKPGTYPIRDLVPRILECPTAQVIFAGLETPKRQVERVISLIQGGLNSGGLEYSYLHDPGGRCKHSISAESIGTR